MAVRMPFTAVFEVSAVMRFVLLRRDPSMPRRSDAATLRQPKFTRSVIRRFIRFAPGGRRVPLGDVEGEVVTKPL
ncbi:hypothetical protein GCM10009775_09210 [Microbacterium aoyamense]|uniref:Uncharacterized protein n=1 Tax=Microbacterium aoyamense TaxID=344166 RepID=A0ABP5ANU1_9MICO